MWPFESMMVELFMEWLSGEKADGLGYGGLEEPSIFGVGGTVGWKGLAEGEEC